MSSPSSPPRTTRSGSSAFATSAGLVAVRRGWRPTEDRSRRLRGGAKVGTGKLGKLGKFAGVCVALLAASTVGCFAPSNYAAAPARAPVGEVTVIAPRCVGASSCVLGHVTAAETGAPLSRAAIFMEDARPEGEGAPRVILALTDDQGVFTIVDPPPGHYRLAVYAKSRKAEVRGLEIAATGTTMVPVRLAAGAL